LNKGVTLDVAPLFIFICENYPTSNSVFPYRRIVFILQAIFRKPRYLCRVKKWSFMGVFFKWISVCLRHEYLFHLFIRERVIKQLTILVMLTGMFFLENSCQKDHPSKHSTINNVNISLNWNDLMIGETIPSDIVMLFYNSDGTVIKKACSSTGFSGTLPAGSYQVLAYNTDVTGVAFRNMEKYTEAQVYVISQTKAAYISQPSHVYGIGLSSLTVSPNGSVSQTLKPSAFVKKAFINLNIPDNLSAVSTCSTSLNGIVSAINIATGLVQSEYGTILFTPSITATGFTSTVSFFGQDSASTNQLDVVLNFVGGGNQTLNVDLTPSLTGVIPVNIDISVSIKITGSVQSGFNATLKDWSVKNRDITVE